jgi:hypothetical protein
MKKVAMHATKPNAADEGGNKIARLFVFRMTCRPRLDK